MQGNVKFESRERSVLLVYKHKINDKSRFKSKREREVGNFLAQLRVAQKVSGTQITKELKVQLE